MDRRHALRAAAALVAGTAAACDAGSPSRPPVATTPARPERTANPPSPPGEITHGPRDRARVALTFHGQGEPILVSRLLDRLAVTGTRVTRRGSSAACRTTWIRCTTPIREPTRSSPPRCPQVRPGSIVSLHFGHAGTVAALPGLLTGLRRRGLTPVTMTDLIA